MDAFQLGNEGLPRRWDDQKNIIALSVFMLSFSVTVGVFLPVISRMLADLPALGFFYYILLSATSAGYAVILVRFLTKKLQQHYHNKFNRSLAILNKYGKAVEQKAIDRINASRRQRREMVEREDADLKFLATMIASHELNIKYNGFEDVDM